MIDQAPPTVDRARALNTLTEAIDALTQEHRHVHREPTWDRNRNRTHRELKLIAPPLLTALEVATRQPKKAALGDQDAHAVPGPRTLLNLDAYDRLRAISDAADEWLQAFASHEAYRPLLTDRLRALVGMAARIDAESLDQLAHDARRWQTWAETLTGNRTPPWTPNAPCPVEDCQKMHGLRVVLSAARAYCRWCGTTWDTDTIRTLGRHVAAHTNRPIPDPEAAS